ncbi:MAG TPA: FAD-dependent oxidoreductase, partial [Terriglobales bacterium]|nr:FAD-dependent oxidoreductase [Terriglobales bacterium]
MRRQESCAGCADTAAAGGPGDTCGGTGDTPLAEAGVSDFLIIGGGIVGLALARALLLRQPGLRLTVLEKEPQVASHQTGHNSGVVHTG